MSRRQSSTITSALTVGDLIRGTGESLPVSSGTLALSGQRVLDASKITGTLSNPFSEDRPQPLISPPLKLWHEVPQALKENMVLTQQRVAVIAHRDVWYLIPSYVLDAHQSVILRIGELGEVSITYCAICNSAVALQGRYGAAALFFGGNRVFYNMADNRVFVTQVTGIPFRIEETYQKALVNGSQIQAVKKFQVTLNPDDLLPARFGVLMVDWKVIHDLIVGGGPAAQDQVRMITIDTTPLTPYELTALDNYRHSLTTLPQSMPVGIRQSQVRGNAKDLEMVAMVRPVGPGQQVYMADVGNLRDQVCCYPLPIPFSEFVFRNSLRLQTMYLAKGEDSQAAWQKFSPSAPVAISMYSWARQAHFPGAVNLETFHSQKSQQNHHCHQINQTDPEDCYGLDCRLTSSALQKLRAISSPRSSLKTNKSRKEEMADVIATALNKI